MSTLCQDSAAGGNGTGSSAGEVALLDWLVALREHRSKRDDTPIAPRTVRNVASSVRVFFADATERKVLRRNPTAGWNADRHLPPIEDKERGWRAQAGFTLAQVVALTTDHRIPEDRRILYALRFLGGPRPGEAASARWRDLDRSRRPLWRLTLEAAFNSPMRREKATKTGATLHIPIHPVLQELLESWWAEGWERFMGRAPQEGDLIFPREDGQHRLVSGTYKQFMADLETLGLPLQRQYETRSTFRNLALSAGASEFHLNLITHPKPKRASDYYTRLEMQWPGMCDAVLAIAPAAWRAAPAQAAAGEVTARVTARVTVEGSANEKPPVSLEETGGKMEREKGFESPALPVISRTYDPAQGDRRDPSQPTDASGRDGIDTDAGDVRAATPSSLPSPSPDLFIAAGAIVAGRAASAREPRVAVERLLHRAVDQAEALRAEAA